MRATKCMSDNLSDLIVCICLNIGVESYVLKESTHLWIDSLFTIAVQKISDGKMILNVILLLELIYEMS